MDYARGVAYTLANLADAAQLREEHPTAVQRIEEALSLCVERQIEELVPILLELLAQSRVEMGDLRSARFCLSAAQSLRLQRGAPRSTGEQARADAVAAHLANSGEGSGDVLGRVALEKLSLSEIVREATRRITV